jgi:hypothetical protein
LSFVVYHVSPLAMRTNLQAAPRGWRI